MKITFTNDSKRRTLILSTLLGALGLTVALVTQAAPPPGPGGPPARMQGPALVPPPCCEITAIDVRGGVVAARAMATGKTFQFRAPQNLLPRLRPGQRVWVDNRTLVVSVEGALNCCKLVQQSTGTGVIGSPAQSSTKDTKSTKGEVKAPSTPPITASEGTTAGAIRGRPAPGGTRPPGRSGGVQPLPLQRPQGNLTHPAGNASPLFNMTLNQSMVRGGASVDGTVSLTGMHAPGQSIFLKSSNPSVAQVPAKAYLSTRSNTTTFKVTTYPVMQAGPVTISVSYGGLTKTAKLTVQPPSIDRVSVMGVDPSLASSNSPFSLSGSLYLTGPAPSAGIKVVLSSNNPLAAVPTSVLVVPGTSRADFMVVVSPITGPTPVTITASYNGVTKTSPSLTIAPVSPDQNAFSITLPTTSVKGGTTVIGTLTINNSNLPSTTITLSSSNPSVAAVPMSVAVAPTITTAAFTVTTTKVAKKTSVTISASSGSYTKTAILEVLH